MKARVLLFTISFSVFASCTNSSADKQNELELKEKKLSLKERELQVKEKEDSIHNISKLQVVVNSASTSKPNELSNVENLIGYWLVPHVAIINIRFSRDGRFIFNDHNATLDKDEKLQGSYLLENGILTLLYDDRPKQKFRSYKGEKGDNNYYIKNTDYYFVKGENGYDN